MNFHIKLHQSHGTLQLPCAVNDACLSNSSSLIENEFSKSLFYLDQIYFNTIFFSNGMNCYVLLKCLLVKPLVLKEQTCIFVNHAAIWTLQHYWQLKRTVSVIRVFCSMIPILETRLNMKDCFFYPCSKLMPFVFYPR